MTSKLLYEFMEILMLESERVEEIKYPKGEEFPHGAVVVTKDGEYELTLRKICKNSDKSA